MSCASTTAVTVNDGVAPSVDDGVAPSVTASNDSVYGIQIAQNATDAAITSAKPAQTELDAVKCELAAVKLELAKQKQREDALLKELMEEKAENKRITDAVTKHLADQEKQSAKTENALREFDEKQRVAKVQTAQLLDDGLDYNSDSVKVQWRSHIYRKDDKEFIPWVQIDILPIEWDNGLMHIMGDEYAKLWADTNYRTICSYFRKIAQKHMESGNAATNYVLTDAHQKEMETCKLFWTNDLDVAKGLCKRKHITVSFPEENAAASTNVFQKKITYDPSTKTMEVELESPAGLSSEDKAAFDALLAVSMSRAVAQKPSASVIIPAISPGGPTLSVSDEPSASDLVQVQSLIDKVDKIRANIAAL